MRERESVGRLVLEPHDLEVHMYERFSVLIGRLWTLSRDDFKREDGQTVTEYGIVLGVLVVALAVTVMLLNTGITTFLNKITTKLNGLI